MLNFSEVARIYQMKFSCTKKIPIDDLLESLKVFLKENYDKYPYTKGSCNLYIKLQDEEGASPNNEADYKFDGQKFVLNCNSKLNTLVKWQ